MFPLKISKRPRAVIATALLLASATPSLESWHLSRPPEQGGRYVRLHMPSRIGQSGPLPLVRRGTLKVLAITSADEPAVA